MRRLTKAALGGLAGCALVLGGTQLASGLETNTYRFNDGLSDLRAPDSPYDSTHARVTIVRVGDSTLFSVKVRGIDVSAADQLFGAHLHIGPCKAGDGSAADRHYNHQMAPAGSLINYALAVKNTETEVWFDFVPDREDGTASFETTVPFVPVDTDGDMSIVIHENPTTPVTGSAGMREACLPLNVDDIFPAE